MPQVVIRLEKPIDQNYIEQNNGNVIREDELNVYLSVPANNRYKGDDESIVYDISHRILQYYTGSYSIVWDESEY